MPKIAIGFALAFASSIQLFGQKVDWEEFFHNAISRDRAIQDAARERGLGQLVPLLCYGKSEIVAPEIPGLAAQLNDSNPDIRMQASAFLATAAHLRTDGSAILAPAVQVLIDHVQDPRAQTRENCTNALAIMKPEVPRTAIPLLLNLAAGDDSSVLPAAIFGTARAADSNTEAADVLSQILFQSSGRERQKIVLGALARAGVTNRELILDLGIFLSHKDKDLQRLAMLAINELRPDAVTLNRSQLEIFAGTSTDEELAALARRLLNP